MTGENIKRFIELYFENNKETTVKDIQLFINSREEVGKILPAEDIYDILEDMSFNNKLVGVGSNFEKSYTKKEK
jgi:hypothetical protein